MRITRIPNVRLGRSTLPASAVLDRVYKPPLDIVRCHLIASDSMKAVTIRFSPGALSDVDRVRKRVPRETWIRDLCADAVLAQDLTDGYRAGDASHVEPEVIDSSASEATHQHSGREDGQPPVRLSRTQTQQLADQVPRRPAGGMVSQPRPIVQKASRGKR